MQLGTQTVTFVTITQGPVDPNGIPAEIRTETPVQGCLFRPLRVDEKVGLTDNIATEVWKATCPPVTAAVAASVVGELKHNGSTYQQVGAPQPYRDLSGVLDHVTVMCRRQDA